MLYRSMSSVCQAKDVFHMPKYRYGVFTPSMVIPLSFSTRSRMVFSRPIFHSSTCCQENSRYAGKFRKKKLKKYAVKF